MSATGKWLIPPSTFRWLAEAPADRPVVALLRHSVRHPIPRDGSGNEVPLTEDGHRLGRELGAIIGSRLRGLHASPVIRCIQTAEALRAGAGVGLEVLSDRLLGHPGIYVLDSERNRANWEDLGHEAVVNHLVANGDPLPGMAAADEAARFLVLHMLGTAGTGPGIHVFVTHDSLVTATAARVLHEHLGRESWPKYLQAAFFWRSADGVVGAYGGTTRTDRRDSLCGLDDGDVLEFARREIAWTIGSDCPARFFLAGGAFKTVLTGRPPSDLDIWAPSDADREMLVKVLLDRGARQLESKPFAAAFRIADRIVELPFHTNPSTLEGRLERSDIALSAVGVEHLPGDTWRVLVHPLAHESVRRREVLLLKPLINWKYVLATLDRARRYSAELGYRVPPEEEAEVWRVFESQPADMRRGMLERFDRSARGGHGVHEEAECRLG
jgi:broad specificity phosphatase PhoE